MPQMPQALLFPFDLDPITRRGDSIVPPPLEPARAERLPLSHADDPETSKSAASSMTQGAKQHRTAILVALKLFGAQTADELADRIGLHPSQVARRCVELLDDESISRRRVGWQDGKPVWQTRLTRSGRPACVYHLSPFPSA